MQKVDVLIVGAGMVGLTLALALRKNSHLTIAIADTLPITSLSEVPETRVSAINLASKNIFENLGVWSAMASSRVQAYQHMHVWDKSGLGKLDFSIGDIDTFPYSKQENEQLGWIIENKVIRNALWKKAQADQGIKFYTQSKLANIALGESEVFASFENNSAPIIAKLIVGADGANSWVRQQMNMGLTSKPYGHHAIVATVKCAQGHHNTAWQVFLAQGPLAFLPLSLKAEGKDLCSIVYSTSPIEAKRLIDLDEREFSKELSAATDGKLGEVTLLSERSSYPLTMRLANNVVKERVVLIGDAAHTIHPLAGQGVNLGLLDAAALAQTLLPDIVQDTLGQDDEHRIGVKQQGKHAREVELNNQQALKAFARWRKTEASEMIAAMAAIKQAYTSQQSAITFVRGLGMNLINHLPMAKKYLIAQALGLKSDLPVLAYKVNS